MCYMTGGQLSLEPHGALNTTYISKKKNEQTRPSPRRLATKKKKRRVSRRQPLSKLITFEPGYDELTSAASRLGTFPRSLLPRSIPRTSAKMPPTPSERPGRRSCSRAFASQGKGTSDEEEAEDEGSREGRCLVTERKLAGGAGEREEIQARDAAVAHTAGCDRGGVVPCQSSAFGEARTESFDATSTKRNESVSKWLAMTVE